MAVPVVLVHGLRTSSTMWRPQVRALEAAGHRVTAVDLPGHGRRIEEEFTFVGAVETVADAARRSGGRALVVGLSLGGYTSIACAARYPELVAGLVAAGCSTRPAGVGLRGWELLARGIARLPDRGARLNQAFVDLLLPGPGAADVGAGGFALDVTVPVLREMRAARPLDDLRAVQAPVWLVNGRLDHFRTQERRFLAACADGRLVVVPRATHLVSVVAPVAFTRIVLEAAAQVEGC